MIVCVGKVINDNQNIKKNAETQTREKQLK